MTTATIFSSVSYNQNAAGTAPIPAPTVVNTGAPITRQMFMLTVTPSTGWAKAAVRGSAGGTDFHAVGEVFAAPFGNGTGMLPVHDSVARQYFSGEVFEVSPGASATLTVTY